MLMLLTFVELEKKELVRKFMISSFNIWKIMNTKITVLNKKSTLLKEMFLIMFQELMIQEKMTDQELMFPLPPLLIKISPITLMTNGIPMEINSNSLLIMMI